MGWIGELGVMWRAARPCGSRASVERGEMSTNETCGPVEQGGEVPCGGWIVEVPVVVTAVAGARGADDCKMKNAR